MGQHQQICDEEERAVQLSPAKMVGANSFVQRIDDAQLSDTVRPPEVCQLGLNFVAEMSQEGQKRLRPL